MTTDKPCGHILNFMFDNTPVRGALIRLEDLRKHIPTLEKEGFGISKYLSEMITASATLMADLKHEADITLQIHSKSDIPLMVSQCTAEGHLRAYANISENARTDITFNDIVNNEGMFIVTVNQNDHNYQSLVALNSTSISSSVEQYFNESVQLPTYFKVYHEKENGQTKCSALLLQVMPNAGEVEDDWRRLGMILGTINNDEILPGKLTDEEILFRLFAEDQIRTFPKKDLSFPPSDSRNRMLNALKKVGLVSCKELISEGNIEMVCEFTGKTETFKEDDLKELFGSQWDE